MTSALNRKDKQVLLDFDGSVRGRPIRIVVYVFALLAKISPFLSNLQKSVHVNYKKNTIAIFCTHFYKNYLVVLSRYWTIPISHNL